MLRRRLIAGASLAAWALAAALVASAASEETWSESAVRTRFPDPDAAAAPESFADNAECSECHEDRVKSLGTSFHKAMLSSKKSGTKGCQECHGPGQVHVDEAGDTPMRSPADTADLPARPPAKAKDGEPPRPRVTVAVKAMNGTCLRCHADVLVKPVEGHREWLGRTRDPAGERSCVSCHAVHVDASRPEYDASVGPFPTAAALAEKAEHVSPAFCVGCHTEFHPEMARSGHAFLAKEGPDHACEACHGNGSLHAQSGGDRRKILLPTNQRAADANAACDACHSGSDATAKWTCSEHARQGLACIQCHDANAAKGRTLRDPSGGAAARPARRQSAEFALCGSCHADVAVKFGAKNRHRVAEGRMDCSDCHDPHGNTDRVRDRDVGLAACAACHQDKAGPFLFDHGIKRGEGCTACHDPHGGTNRRMLTHDRVRPMCLQCHPETPHDLRLARYQNCISCHTEIHGSHLDRKFLK